MSYFKALNRFKNIAIFITIFQKLSGYLKNIGYSCFYMPLEVERKITLFADITHFFVNSDLTINLASKKNKKNKWPNWV